VWWSGGGGGGFFGGLRMWGEGAVGREFVLGGG
jgi:hypothetical protein